jgi:hypothetical protein
MPSYTDIHGTCIDVITGKDVEKEYLRTWTERPIFGKKEISVQKINLLDLRWKREREIRAKKQLLRK